MTRGRDRLLLYLVDETAVISEEGRDRANSP